MNNELLIYCDGGARGNPGPGAIGVIFKNTKGETVKRISKTIGFVTNNEAEYRAIIEALSTLKTFTRPLTTTRVYLDSRLVVEQLNGRFRTKEPRLREFILKIRILEAEIGSNIQYCSIKREQNQDADRLVNQALDGDNSYSV